MKAWVVIPTLNGRERLLKTLASLEQQSVRASVVVVDNGSNDGTAEAVAERHPTVRVVRNERNLGFGAAINRAALELEGGILVLVNNDVVCEPAFLERITAPFADESVGMAAGVLLQAKAPELIDSAGIELDTTLGSWDYLWNAPVEALAGAHDPVGPCGGAAAYRLPVFQELGGFDEVLFAYWEDVELALRFRARAGAARWCPAHGRCTSMDKRSVRRHRRRGAWRPSAEAMCSPSTASAAARSGRRKLPCSTGRCWSSTCCSGARRARSGSDSALGRGAFSPPEPPHRSSSRPLVSPRRSGARRSSCGFA